MFSEELSQITLVCVFENDVECVVSLETPMISYDVCMWSDFIERLLKIASVAARMGASS